MPDDVGENRLAPVLWPSYRQHPAVDTELYRRTVVQYGRCQVEAFVCGPGAFERGCLLFDAIVAKAFASWDSDPPLNAEQERGVERSRQRIEARADR